MFHLNQMVFHTCQHFFPLFPLSPFPLLTSSYIRTYIPNFGKISPSTIGVNSAQHHTFPVSALKFAFQLRTKKGGLESCRGEEGIKLQCCRDQGWE